MMKEQDYQMGDQVNKIVANTLVKAGGVFIPGYGSLTVETTSTREDGTPIRGVRFSKEEHHRSLVLIISERAKCTLEQAERIFERWLKLIKSDEGGRLIDGVGLLRKKSFMVDAAILERLNVALEVAVADVAVVAESSEEELKSEFTDEADDAVDMVKTEDDYKKSNVMEEKSSAPKKSMKQDVKSEEAKSVKKESTTEESKSSGLKWLVAVVVLLVVVVGGMYMNNASQKREAQEQKIAAQMAAKASEERALEVQRAKEIAAKEAALAREMAAKNSFQSKIAAIIPTTDPSKLVTLKAKTLPEERAMAVLEQRLSQSVKGGRYRVVYGVMSSEVNAGRAIVDIDTRCKGVEEVKCGVHPFGYSYMVTLFESDNRDEAAEFVATFGERISSKAWIFDVKNPVRK